jgi:hypothetical protein
MGDTAGPFGKAFKRLSTPGERMDLQSFAAETLDHSGAYSRRSTGHKSCLVIRERHEFLAG